MRIATAVTLTVLAGLAAVLWFAWAAGKPEAPERAAGSEPVGGSPSTGEAARLSGSMPRARTSAEPAAPAPVVPLAPPDTWQPRSIRGRLLFPDGSPAAGVDIGLGSVASRPNFLRGSSSIGTKTDAEGAFALNDLDDGTYGAFADEERGARTWRLRRVVEPGPKEVTWTLDEGRLVLTVTVLDPEGKKASAASVHLIAGDDSLYAYASDGVARFFEFADEPLRGPVGVVAELFYDEVPADQRAALWAATAIDGVDLGKAEVVLRTERGGTIEGRVASGPDGVAALGTVYASAMGGGLRAHWRQRKAAIGPDGRFRFDAMAAGPWGLSAWGELLATLTVSRVVEAGASDVVLDRIPTKDARVRVVDPAGRPVPGATVVTHLLFEDDGSAVTDDAGVAVLRGLAPGPHRSLRATATGEPMRGANLEDWVVGDATMVVKPSRLGDSQVAGVATDTSGAPLSFVAVWSRQGDLVGKQFADEAGRFTLEGLESGPVTLEVRLAKGWDQPPSMAPAITMAATAPTAGVELRVDLGSTLRVWFPNWPHDVERAGAVLVDEATGSLVRPMSWTWNGLRFARLDPRATYTLFAHAEATEYFTRTTGLRAGKDLVVRLERGVTVAGRLRGVEPGDETKVVAVLHGVKMGADLAADGRFEVAGLPAGMTVDLVATAVREDGTPREARAKARAGETGAILDLAVPPR